MAFTLIYTALTFLSMDTFPALEHFRLQLVLAVCAITLSVIPFLTRMREILTVTFWLTLAFTGFTIVSTWPHGWIGGAVLIAQKLMPSAMLFFLVVINLQTVRRLRLLRAILVIITLYMLVRGFAEYFMGSDESPYVMYQRVEGMPAIRRLRALGVLADPNTYSQFLLAIVPMLFVRRDRQGPTLRWAFILPMLGVLVYAISLTRSRGALLGLVVLIGLVVRDRVQLLASGAVSGILMAVLAGLNFAGGRSISIGGGMDRLNLWSEGLGMFKRSPLWGGGWGSFPDNFRLTAHNSFLLAACELGIIGYFLWFSMILTVVWQLQEVIREPALDKGEGLELKRWARATLYSLYIFLLTSFFLSQTYDPLLYLLLGTGATIAAMAAAQSGRQSFLPRKNWAIWSLGLCCASLLVIYGLVRLRAV